MRFPFIVLGAIPWCFIVIFIFVAPSVEEIGHFGVFLWLLLIFSAVVDNATKITKIRSEGLYNGINLFFSRINIAVQAIVFWIMMVQQASLN
jgi:Na+/melibiose symporter-like transporter